MSRYICFLLSALICLPVFGEEEVETSKKLSTIFGPVTISVDDKPEPEPALKPYWLTIAVDCKSGKKHTQRLDVCDSDLSFKLQGDILKVNYFLADPVATDGNREDDLICDEESTLETELNLKSLCTDSKVKKTKSKK